MRLTSISLINFRNYEKNEFITDNDHVVLLGKNGAGKTNFLEAVYCLSTSRSFRTSTEENLVFSGKDFFSISGQITETEIRHSIEIVYTKNATKSVVFDGQKSSVKNLISRMSAVVFHNDDIEMIRGQASIRRRYLDTVLSQTDPEYYHNIVIYNRLLRQKKELLKKKTYRLSI